MIKTKTVAPKAAAKAPAKPAPKAAAISTEIDRKVQGKATRKTRPLAIVEPAAIEPAAAPALPELPAEGDVRPAFLRRKDEEAAAPEAPRKGLCATRNEALAAGRTVYGPDAVLGVDFEVIKTARGEWYWGTLTQQTQDRLAMAAKLKGAKPPKEAKKERKDAIKSAKAAVAGETRADGLKPGTAAAKMVDAVLAPEGITYAELLTLTGWGECRPALVKACQRAGVTLRLDKAVKPSRYYGTRA